MYEVTFKTQQNQKKKKSSFLNPKYKWMNIKLYVANKFWQYFILNTIKFKGKELLYNFELNQISMLI